MRGHRQLGPARAGGGRPPPNLAWSVCCQGFLGILRNSSGSERQQLTSPREASVHCHNDCIEESSCRCSGATKTHCDAGSRGTNEAGCLSNPEPRVAPHGRSMESNCDTRRIAPQFRVFPPLSWHCSNYITRAILSRLTQVVCFVHPFMPLAHA